MNFVVSFASSTKRKGRNRQGKKQRQLNQKIRKKKEKKEKKKEAKEKWLRDAIPMQHMDAPYLTSQPCQSVAGRQKRNGKMYRNILHIGPKKGKKARSETERGRSELLGKQLFET